MPTTAERFTTMAMLPGEGLTDGIIPEEGETIIDDWEAPEAIPQLVLLRDFDRAELMALLWNTKEITVTTTPVWAFGETETELYLASDNGTHAAVITGAQIVSSALTTAPAPRERVAGFVAEDYTDGDLYSSFNATKMGRTWHFSQNQVPYFPAEDGGFEVTLEVARILKQGDEFALVMAVRIFYTWAYAGASGMEELTSGAWAVLIPNTVTSDAYESVGGDPTLLQSLTATIFGRSVPMYFYVGTEGFHPDRLSYAGSTTLTIAVTDSYTYP